MPISFTDEELDQIEKTEGGKGLRARLEEALSDNRKLTQKVAAGEARDVIAEHGLTLVTPEELAGVAIDDLEAKARELQEQKLESQSKVLREIHERKGLEGDDLEAAVQADLGVLAEPKPSFTNVNKVNAMGGRPARNDDVDAPPMDDFTAGIEDGARARRSRRV